jgi:SAM-dependent methyltransferase
MLIRAYNSLNKYKDILKDIHSMVKNSYDFGIRPYEKLWSYIDQYGLYSHEERQTSKILTSQPCRATDIEMLWGWLKQLGKSDSIVRHRKHWELAYISQALFERGMLTEGKRGLGFAVGKEQLPSLFAKHGCKIMATDIEPSGNKMIQNWVKSNQHGDSTQDLFYPEICPKEIYFQNVEFEYLDMNTIPGSVTGYDFCWSTCAFEHLGSIELGKKFISRMIDCLKPGGVAVHTTELNLSSNSETVFEGDTVLYRQQDFIEMANTLSAKGHHVAPLDFRLDNSTYTGHISFAPYKEPIHLILLYAGFIATCFGLIIQKRD